MKASKVFIVSGTLILCFSLLTLYSFRKNNSVFKKEYQVSNDTLSDPLAIYGKYVYEKESCNKCHNFISDGNKDFISLDGIGRKYPSIWLYAYLLEPRSLMPDSKKLGYEFLYDRKIDEKILIELLNSNEKNGLLDNITLVREKINESSKSIIKDIKTMNYTVHSYTEIIALIAYLQQVPVSPLLKQKDSLRKEKERETDILWKKIISDNNSSLRKILLNNSHSDIKSGKKIFINYCAVCHGEQAQGNVGPNLTDEYWLHGGNAIDITKTIAEGVIEKGMPNWKYFFTPSEVAQLTTFIISLKGTKSTRAKEPQGVSSTGKRSLNKFPEKNIIIKTND